MKRNSKSLQPLWCLAFVVGLLACNRLEQASPGKAFSGFEAPSHFPKVSYDLASNPVTKEGFDLGRMLFYDPILSADGSVSCGFCHLQTAAFTQHGHALSHGISNGQTRRNSMPIQNLAWSVGFGWDGGVSSLDQFAITAIENPKEMGESLPNVLRKLRASPTYPALVTQAFKPKVANTDAITGTNLLRALAQFQVMCVSANSRYDAHLTAYTKAAPLTQTELRGLSIFRERCAACHKEPLLSDQSFRNNGLPVNKADDTGLELITENPANRYQFKVPSLRNVTFTAPYMHDGRFGSLSAVVDHYRSGVQASPTLDPLLQQDGRLGIAISDAEKNDLIAFMRTLADSSFISNYELSEFAQ